MLELAVVLTILAILLTLAVPSFNELIQSNRLSADASNVLSQLAYARSEATKRRSHIVICGSRDQFNCDPSTGANWSAGWIIFADSNGDGILAANAPPCPTDTPTTTSDCVLRVQGALSANDQLSNAAKLTSIVMRANGSLGNTTEPVQFTLCTDKTLARDKEHEIILGTAGHVSHNPFTCTTGKRH